MVTYSYRKLAMVEKFLDYDGIRSSVYIYIITKPFDYVNNMQNDVL